MKKIISLTILTLCFCLNAAAQAAPDNAAATVERIQLVAALERAQAEVKASRKYVDALNEQIESKEKIIQTQQRRQTLADSAIASSTLR